MVFVFSFLSIMSCRVKNGFHYYFDDYFCPCFTIQFVLVEEALVLKLLLFRFSPFKAMIFISCLDVIGVEACPDVKLMGSLKPNRFQHSVIQSRCTTMCF